MNAGWNGRFRKRLGPGSMRPKAVDDPRREDTPTVETQAEERTVGGVDVGYSTNVGLRGKNDDFGCFEVFDDRLACALADGIGGAPFGNMAARVASLSAVKRLRSIVDSEAVDDPADSLISVLSEADVDVCKLKSLIGTDDDGTTLLVALQDGASKGLIRLAWIGDTVAFHFEAAKGSVSPVGCPGRMSPGDNYLDGALGYRADIAGLSRSGTVRMAQGDLVVLCTDGVWDVPGALDPDRLADLAPLGSGAVARGVVDLAVDILGGSDNATAIVIKALPELF